MDQYRTRTKAKTRQGRCRPNSVKLQRQYVFTSKPSGRDRVLTRNRSRILEDIRTGRVWKYNWSDIRYNGCFNDIPEQFSTLVGYGLDFGFQP